MAATDSVNIIELKAQTAIEFWPELVPFVLKALDFDPYQTVTVGELLEQVQKGFARVLIAVDGPQLLSATLIQLFKTVSGDRVLHVVTTAGENSNDWLPALIDKFREIAATESCQRVTMSGRPGWTKKVNKFGFKVAHVTMEMRIESNGQFQQEQG